MSGEPSLVADDWFAGVDASLRLLKMESVYRNGNIGRGSRQREFTLVNQSQPEMKVTPKGESKIPFQTEKIAQRQSVPEKTTSSIPTMPSDLKKASSPDLREESQKQKFKEPESIPITKGTEKTTPDAKDEVPTIETKNVLLSGPCETVILLPLN